MFECIFRRRLLVGLRYATSSPHTPRPLVRSRGGARVRAEGLLVASDGERGGRRPLEAERGGGPLAGGERLLDGRHVQARALEAEEAKESVRAREPPAQRLLVGGERGEVYRACSTPSPRRPGSAQRPLSSPPPSAP